MCFDNTSISEIVEHKINGYVVKDFNSNSLVVGIEWLLNKMKNN